MNIELKNWTIRSAPAIVEPERLRGKLDLNGTIFVGRDNVSALTLIGPGTVRIKHAVGTFTLCADGIGEELETQQQVKR